MTNETKVKHTPTPWRVDPHHWGDIQAIDEALDNAIEVAGARWDGMPDGIGREPDIPVARANIEFIVRAANNHDALVKMANDLLICLKDEDDTFDLKYEARKILANLKI